MHTLRPALGLGVRRNENQKITIQHEGRTDIEAKGVMLR